MLRHAVKPCGGCAIVLRLQVRGAPARRCPRLAWAPARAFLRSRCPALLERPGRAVRGTPVYRATGPLDPLQCSGSPVAWAFAGTSVHRTLVFIRLTHRTLVFIRLTHWTLACCRLTHRALVLFRLTHWRLGKSAAHPGRARSGRKTATGTSPSAASPRQARCPHPEAGNGLR